MCGAFRWVMSPVLIKLCVGVKTRLNPLLKNVPAIVNTPGFAMMTELSAINDVV